jgi:hypothetical protein
MRRRDHGRDLVLSMTLAEIFLLLLFVVWWSSYLPAVEVNGVPLTVLEMQARLETLTADNDRLSRDNRILRQLLGIGPDVPTEKLEAAVKDAIDRFRRGHPRCEESNVLVHVTLIGGAARLKFLQSVADVVGALSPGTRRRAAAQAELVDAEVDEVLAATSRVYRARRAAGRDCRFDYRLSYASDSDYREGRERFERVFYAAGGIERIRRQDR